MLAWAEVGSVPGREGSFGGLSRILWSGPLFQDPGSRRRSRGGNEGLTLGSGGDRADGHGSAMAPGQGGNLGPGLVRCSSGCAGIPGFAHLESTALLEGLHRLGAGRHAHSNG